MKESVKKAELRNRRTKRVYEIVGTVLVLVLASWIAVFYLESGVSSLLTTGPVSFMSVVLLAWTFHERFRRRKEP